MTKKVMKTIGIAATVVLLIVGTTLASPPDSHGSEAGDPIRILIKPLPEGVSRVFLTSTTDGRRQFELVHIDGSVEQLSSEAFAQRLYKGQAGKPRFYRLLNITSPIGIAWVLLGLIGQVLFTGRMVLQWLTSEKARRSIIPVGFWWMSLAGASMLLIYFIWRRDIVGILGQTTGWLIYVRNLWLIYRNSSDELQRVAP